ncbi:MAG: NVEALA domain-containing protein [Bacteroides sp.]|nr:NVEALA domain-containing protein [Bacteroides sp.]MCM1390743.1 NVEALA domain-containing protein [Bacteroides sp.]
MKKFMVPAIAVAAIVGSAFGYSQLGNTSQQSSVTSANIEALSEVEEIFGIEYDKGCVSDPDESCVPNKGPILEHNRAEN